MTAAYVILYLSKPTEYTPPRVNPTLTYARWVIAMCQYKFINRNKCPTLVGDMDVGGIYAAVGTGGIDRKSLDLPLNFIVNLKPL